jgi:hypothetical protein
MKYRSHTERVFREQFKEQLVSRSNGGTVCEVAQIEFESRQQKGRSLFKGAATMLPSFNSAQRPEKAVGISIKSTIELLTNIVPIRKHKHAMVVKWNFCGILWP